MERTPAEDLVLFTNPSRENGYFYVPRGADAQRTPDGLPALSLIAWGSGGYLTLTTEWRASEACMADARRYLAGQAGLMSPEAITLSFAPVTVTGCTVFLTEENGSKRSLGSSQTSRFPPYSAVFSALLSADQFVRARAALHGSRGILTVEYEAVLTRAVTVTGRLTPCSAALVEWLRPYREASESEFRHALEDAVHARITGVALDSATDADAELVSTIFERVLDRATALLRRWLRDTPSGTSIDFEVAIRLARDVRVPIRGELDLATVGKPELIYSSIGRGAKDAAD